MLLTSSGIPHLLLERTVWVIMPSRFLSVLLLSHHWSRLHYQTVSCLLDYHTLSSLNPERPDAQLLNGILILFPADEPLRECDKWAATEDDSTAQQMCHASLYYWDMKS